MVNIKKQHILYPLMLLLMIPIAFAGPFADRLRNMGDVNLWVDSTQYNTVEIAHQTWILSIIDYLIDNKF